MLQRLSNRARRAYSQLRGHVVNDGVRLTLRKASPAMREALLIYGYEKEDSALARQVLKAGDKILELGSAVGFLAIFCRTQLGIRDYAMVEANAALLPLVRENFRLNRAGLPEVRIAAAGASDGTVRLNLDRDYWASSTRQPANPVGSVEVEQRSIASLLAELPFTPNTLICDIEGSEAGIALDDWLLFDKIIVELHDHMIGAEPIDRIVAHLEGTGYDHIVGDWHSHAFVRRTPRVLA